MRYTIPGDIAVRARQIARLNTTTRADWWRTVRRGDLLNGLMGRDHLPPVHRERVRFGAWESRPQDATTGRLTPRAGGSEGPPVSGPENAYKCEGAP